MDTAFELLASQIYVYASTYACTYIHAQTHTVECVYRLCTDTCKRVFACILIFVFVVILRFSLVFVYTPVHNCISACKNHYMYAPMCMYMLSNFKHSIHPALHMHVYMCTYQHIHE